MVTKSENIIKVFFDVNTLKWCCLLAPRVKAIVQKFCVYVHSNCLDVFTLAEKHEAPWGFFYEFCYECSNFYGKQIVPLKLA